MIMLDNATFMARVLVDYPRDRYVVRFHDQSHLQVCELDSGGLPVKLVAISDYVREGEEIAFQWTGAVGPVA